MSTSRGYQPGLADLWSRKDGKQYGLPKDFDTVAIFYNTKMLEDAGVTPAQLQNLTWNPQDGGTYEKVIARLTVDKKGVRGDEPGLRQAKNVAVYGLGVERRRRRLRPDRVEPVRVHHRLAVRRRTRGRRSSTSTTSGSRTPSPGGGR